MSRPKPKPDSDALYRRLILSEEDRRAHPAVPQWTGGYRWFKSSNVIDLQRYRNSAEKERIRANLLGYRFSRT